MVLLDPDGAAENIDVLAGFGLLVGLIGKQREGAVPSVVGLRRRMSVARGRWGHESDQRAPVSAEGTRTRPRDLPVRGMGRRPRHPRPVMLR